MFCEAYVRQLNSYQLLLGLVNSLLDWLCEENGFNPNPNKS